MITIKICNFKRRGENPPYSTSIIFAFQSPGVERKRARHGRSETSTKRQPLYVQEL